jgi:hypothetical protein
VLDWLGALLGLGCDTPATAPATLSHPIRDAAPAARR